MTAYRSIRTRGAFPQTEPADESQVLNSAGGYVFDIGKWATLDRFLILGTEGGTYYITEGKLTKDGAKNVEACIKEDGVRTVNRIREISHSGRANKNDPALFALAMCISMGDIETKRAAFDALNDVARIGTHIFHFVQFAEQFRGWGRLFKAAVANWYKNHLSENLAYDLIKYRQRDGWGHDDLIKLSHPSLDHHADLYDWTLGTRPGHEEVAQPTYPAIVGYEAVSKATEAKEVVRLIREYNLPREAVPTQYLNDKDVWQALLDAGMGMEALVRNLGNMGSVGILAPLSDASKQVLTQLSDPDRIKRSRIHPIKLLAAYLTYKQGHGMRGSNSWKAVPQVVDALEAAFYTSFGNIVPTGKNTFIGLDVSGSMSSPMQNMPYMTYAMGAVCMGMVVARSEPNYFIGGFHTGLIDLKITARSSLAEAVKQAAINNGGGTDCSMPMQYATKNNLPMDVFVVITDNETWAGRIHPHQALQEYRKKSGREAKLAVVGMAATKFSIADPKDRGMMDFVGFDLNTPEAISEFARI